MQIHVVETVVEHCVQRLAYDALAPLLAGNDVADIAAPMSLAPFVITALTDQPLIAAQRDRPLDAGATMHCLRHLLDQPVSLFDGSVRSATPISHRLGIGEDAEQI